MRRSSAAGWPQYVGPYQVNATIPANAPFGQPGSYAVRWRSAEQSGDCRGAVNSRLYMSQNNYLGSYAVQVHYEILCQMSFASLATRPVCKRTLLGRKTPRGKIRSFKTVRICGLKHAMLISWRC